VQRVRDAVNAWLGGVLCCAGLTLLGSVRVSDLRFIAGGADSPALIMLDDMRELVDEQTFPGRCSRGELALAKVDVGALRERLCTEVRRESCCGRAGVDAHVGEILAEALVHPREHVIGKRLACIVGLAHWRRGVRRRVRLRSRRHGGAGRRIESAREDRLRFEALYQRLFAGATTCAGVVDAAARGRCIAEAALTSTSTRHAGVLPEVATLSEPNDRLNLRGC
jgi:hypothetical protein